jgi:uncharacterized protein YdeI (YjbR/CyaY-like superfamily)
VAPLAGTEPHPDDGRLARVLRLDAVEDLTIPDDLAQALAEQPQATACFERFPRSAKRGILEWIANARTPQSRARRIAETATLASRNERANQWRPKPSRDA